MPGGHLKTVQAPSPNDFNISQPEDKLEIEVDVRRFMVLE